MATSVTLNGTTYSIPATGDSSWGDEVSNYLLALSTGVLQKAGGAFTLTADVDFGGTYGLKSAYYKSRGTVASAGVVRLANAESIGWRNAANSADKLLKVNASNVLEFDGTAVALAAAATATASRALVSDASGYVTASTVTTTELQYLSGVTAPTGTGALVLASSPTLVTPTLGAATATSINKVAFTAPATSATLTLADGKTLTVSNTLTFTGTDSSSVAFGAGGTVAYTGSTLAQFAATTSAQLAGVISDETGSGALVFANTPTLVTPALGAATATSVTATGALTGGTVKMNGATSGALTHQAAATTTDYTVTWPSAQGAASTVLTNDGSGGLSWGAALTTSLADGKIFVGNGSGVATAVTPTGDVTISNAGVTAIASGVIVDADINASAAISGSKLQAAASGVAGAMSTGAQTITGAKLFETSLNVGATSVYKFGVKGAASGSALVKIENTDSTNTSSVLEVQGAATTTSSGGSTFAVGAGSNTSFAVRNDGNVGIGYKNITSASISGDTPYPLTVMGGDGVLKVRTNITSGTNQGVLFADAQGGAGTAGDTCGTITINTTANSVAYNTTSDARIKTAVEDFDGLSLVMQMHPVRFERITDPGTKEYGFLAQELAGVLPQAVTVGGDDPRIQPWGVDYGKLTGVLAKALQELKRQFDEYVATHP